MLAAAYSAKAEWEKYNQAMRRLEQLTPQTSEDYLFKGHALAQGWDYERGLAMIEEAIRRRPSLVASLLLADARTWYACDLTDLKKGEQLLAAAVQDADSAKRLLPGNAFAIWTSFFANEFISFVYDETQQPTKRDEAWARAKANALALDDVIANPDACVAHWLLLRKEGKEKSVQERLRQVSDRPGQIVVSAYWAWTQYRNGDLAACLKILDKWRGNANFDQMRPLVLAELDGNTTRAVAACMDMAAGQFETLADTPVTLLRLFGHNTEAQSLIVDFNKKLSKLPPVAQATTRSSLDYSAGKLTADQLLSASATRGVNDATRTT